MVARRRIDKNKYLAAFAIATLIFVLGLYLGNYISYQKLGQIDELSQELQLNTLGTELQFEMISEEPCQFVNSSELTEELFTIGTHLDFMESELGQTNPQVLSLKEYYHLLEIRHWLLIKKSENMCDETFDVVFYFYSNRGDCPACEEQGSVLTYLLRKRPFPSLSIYSFDMAIDNPALNTLKTLYDVKGDMPILVINEKTYHGFMNSEEIEAQLGS